MEKEQGKKKPDFLVDDPSDQEWEDIQRRELRETRMTNRLTKEIFSEVTKAKLREMVQREKKAETYSRWSPELRRAHIGWDFIISNILQRALMESEPGFTPESILRVREKKVIKRTESAISKSWLREIVKEQKSGGIKSVAGRRELIKSHLMCRGALSLRGGR